MTQMTVYTLLAVFLCGLATSTATLSQCYQCSNCPVPFDANQATKLSNCNYCRTVIKTKEAGNTKVIKDCSVTCVDRSRTGEEIHCCTSDYCNPATSMRPSHAIWAAVIFTGLLPFLCKVF